MAESGAGSGNGDGHGGDRPRVVEAEAKGPRIDDQTSEGATSDAGVEITGEDRGIDGHAAEAGGNGE
ncbi:hypothetical protein RHMOL_Rhmol06G0005700 [Rhododendron molle]|uniref:Uncharacterized protein n=1 Tax=Rhododendron molle TaxID=49168 RepID=A0ACC0N767_RHOML|nr:hypothetical protein RHMOL_Rhmol06G0005700 [Rhododendron molle]